MSQNVLAQNGATYLPRMGPARSMNFLAQLATGRKYWSDGTPVAGQQFEYVFDDIGKGSEKGQEKGHPLGHWSNRHIDRD